MTLSLTQVSRLSVLTLAAFATVFVSAFFSFSSFAHAQDPDVYVSAVATTTPDGSQTAPFPTIEQALAVVPVAGTVHVDNSGVYTIGSTVMLNTANVTLVGTGKPVINVSGSSQAFTVSAPGVTVDGFTFQKTDKTTQSIIQIAASDTSLLNNAFSGQFVIGDAEVSRALVIQGGLTGLRIENNTFTGLRQPAYISGVTTGTVSGNYTAGTKGWVVEQGNLTFSNNTWGQDSSANVYDIAILALTDVAYYTDVAALSQANNGAFIEDQRTSPATLSVVYVDESVAVSGDGTQRSPKKTLAEAVSRVVTGGTIVLASNITTTAQTNITKALTIDGASHTLTAAFSGGSVIQITANNVTIKNLIEDGGTASIVPTTGNRGINVYVATGVTLDSVKISNNSKNGLVVNGSTVTVNNITTSGNGWEAIDVDMGGGVSSLASLTVNGVSTHSETKAAIRIDDTSKTPTPTVVDANSQYDATAVSATTTDYYMKVVVTPTPSGGSHGGSVSAIQTVDTAPATTDTTTTTTTDTTPVQGSVLGASAYNFTSNLTVGSQGEDVTALQEQLTAEGVYTGPITGYFGPLTLAAVKAYQAKHGIITTGFVGPLTLAALNAGVTPTLSDEARAVLQVKIVELLKQLLDLQQKLNTELSK